MISPAEVPRWLQSKIAAGWRARSDQLSAVLLVLFSWLVIYGFLFVAPYASDFSPAVMGMLAVFGVMWIADMGFYCFKKDGTVVDDFFKKYLAEPTRHLNKHMSVGFCVPFVMILKEKPMSQREISLNAACCILLGLLSSLIVFYGMYALCAPWPNCMRRCPAGHRASVCTQKTVSSACPNDFASSRRPSATPTLLPPSAEAPAQAVDGAAASTPATRPDGTSANLENSSGSQEKPLTLGRRILRILQIIRDRYPRVTICVLLLALFGGLSAANPACLMLFDAVILAILWLGTLWLQQKAKTWPVQPDDKRGTRLRAWLAALLNPVLLTSLLLMAYFEARAAIQHAETADIVDFFHTGNTFARFLHGSTTSSNHNIEANFVCFKVPGILVPAGRTRELRCRVGDPLTTTGMQHGSSDASDPNTRILCLGAGDLAVSILEAGLVAWGTKIFECRRELFSIAGLLTSLFSAGAAALTVFGAPHVASAMGLLPNNSLAYAFRSVTLALGYPALERMGGLVGINAVMVVINGVVFQMGAGLEAQELPGWVWRRCGHVFGGKAREGGGVEDLEAGLAPPRTTTPAGGHGAAVLLGPAPDILVSAPAEADTSPDAIREQAAAAAAATTTHDNNGDRTNHTPFWTRFFSMDDIWKVVNGVTIGINAAAMGTSYLYEQASPAAPYSALAMTIFGIVSVSLTYGDDLICDNLITKLNPWV